MAKVLLVTGGARGIGAATCRLAARDGWDVAVNYTANEAAARTVADAVTAAGRRAITVKADVADPDAVTAMYDQVEAGLGPVEGVVASAGVVNQVAPLADLAVAEIRRIIDVDLLGTFWTSREAVRRMSTARGGRGGVIVHISSMAAVFCGAGGFMPYGAAKKGVDSLTEGLGKEVAGEGIRVCGLRPGLIDTDMQSDTGIPDRLARFGHTVPIGRAGTADEVAEAAVWLLSDKASYVAATTFNVSGAR